MNDSDSKEEEQDAEEEEQEEEEETEEIEPEDSKLPAVENNESNPSSNTVSGQDSTTRQQQVAHNPYVAPTPMEVDHTPTLLGLNAGPKDAIRPRTIFRQILCRVDIKVTTKGSTQSDVELVNGIKATMVKLQEADKSIVVLPYAAAHSNLKPLTKFPEDIPSGISKLKKYFQNATPRMNGGSYYIRALLFFNKSFEDTTEDIKWWLGKQKGGIWLRKV